MDLMTVLTTVLVTSLPIDIDRIELKDSDTAFAELHYYNAASRMSVLTSGLLQYDHPSGCCPTLLVRFTIDATPGPEFLRVEPQGPYEAIPDYVVVDDGDTVVIEIHPSMF